jgi:twitching motility protein PilT
VLLTGPTGSGKSTTLAAIIEHANANRKCHIVTIEDPIEFVHHPKQCIVNHREVETHTQSFAKALRAALREDPDIILVGEMRDLETTMLAIEAANTGHLVLSTMHTMGATRTIDRIVDMFPADQQSQIRTSLSESLKGVMSQALFKRSDKPGRIAALEILLVTPAAANLIREQKTFQLMTVIQTGRRLGMISLDDAIADLMQRRLISPEEAFEKAVEKDRFAKLLKNPPPDF